MRILVTGGAGFVGTAIARRLTDLGQPVRAVDAFLPQAHEAVRPPRDSPYELMVGDVRDADFVTRALTDVDVVCHQAAMVGHGLTPSDAPSYVSHNDYGTAVLLAAMAESGIGRLVLASSMVVYGEGRFSCPDHGTVRPRPRTGDDIDAGRYEPRCSRCDQELTPGLVPEDAPLEPRSTYAATKLAQEHLAGAWARQTGGSVWALRYHNVYGPGMPRDTPYAGVASIFRSALESGRAPRVMEDGRQRRDFVHVHDVADANILAVRTQAPAGSLEPVNIASGQVRTVGDLATTLAAAMDGPPPEIIGGARSGDVRHITADPAKARRSLGFTARVTFESGVAAFAHDPLRAPAAAGSVPA